MGIFSKRRPPTNWVERIVWALIFGVGLASIIATALLLLGEPLDVSLGIAVLAGAALTVVYAIFGARILGAYWEI